MKLTSVAVLFASLLVFASVNTVHAQWSAINSNQQCAVTTNYHGELVPLGTPVWATAGTLNPDVKYVEFRWRDPDGNEILPWTEIVPVTAISTPNVPLNPHQDIIDWASSQPTGTVYWYAQARQSPNLVGDWGVQARFLTLDHVEQGKNSDIIATRATSFFALPEIPFGTIATLVSSFGILGLFALRKRRLHQ